MTAVVTDLVVHHEDVMGTVVSFHVVAPSDDVAHGAVDAACRKLHELDAILSLWRPDSPVSQLRSGVLLLQEAPRELVEVLELCRAAVTMTSGWFDPWAMPGGVDPTGLAKGWALEQAARIVMDAGCTSAMVNGGGDIALSGVPPEERGWRVGIQHPWRRDALAAVVVTTRAVATSGSYERGAHLIDPRTGTPSLASASASVVGERLAIADALATALAVGGDDAMKVIAGLDDYEAYLIRHDGSEVATPAFPFAE